MPPAAEGYFGWDWPYTLGPNMGFIALRNTASMRDLVRDWCAPENKTPENKLVKHNMAGYATWSAP